MVFYCLSVFQWERRRLKISIFPECIQGITRIPDISNPATQIVIALCYMVTTLCLRHPLLSEEYLHLCQWSLLEVWSRCQISKNNTCDLRGKMALRKDEHFLTLQCKSNCFKESSKTKHIKAALGDNKAYMMNVYSQCC